MRNRRRPPGEGRLIQSVYYLYVAGSAVARWIPEPVAYGLAQGIGRLGARISKKRATVARNLSRITGEPADSARVQRLVRQAYQSYARYWLETFRLVRADREFFLERVVSPSQGEIDRVCARGKGAIVIVGHLGNWDAAGAWVGARGQALHTVAEVLKPRRMFDFFAEHRARLGMTIFPAQKGVTDKLVASVEEGAVVAILGDRDLKGTGPLVDFFGEPAHFPAGPAVVALRSGTPLLMGGVYSEILPDGKHGWRIDISEPIELPASDGPEAIEELTREVARRMEAMVAKRPEEWHVFQPFWPNDRP